MNVQRSPIGRGPVLPTLLCLLVLLVCPSVQAAPPKEFGRSAKLLQVTFIDVEQGDAIFIGTPDGQRILIDAGDAGDDAGLRVERWLHENRIDAIDLAIITHAHDDHFGGFFHLLDAVPVKKILYGSRGTSASYKKLEAQIARLGIPYEHVGVDTVLELGEGVKAKVLWSGPDDPSQFSSSWTPWRETAEDQDGGDVSGLDFNATSVVLRLSHGMNHFFLNGDVTEKVEEKIADHYDGIPCQIYKAAHHGSKYSNSMKILGEIRPEHAIISCGEGNSFNHPHGPCLERLADIGAAVHRTDHVQHISVWSDGDKLILRDGSTPIVFHEKPRAEAIHPTAGLVHIETSKVSRLELRWWAKGRDGDGEVKIVHGGDMRHAILLDGLEPATTYRVAVTAIYADNSHDTVAEEIELKTPPAADGDLAVTLADAVFVPAEPYLLEYCEASIRVTNTGSDPLEDVTVELFQGNLEEENLLLKQEGVRLGTDAYHEIATPWKPSHALANDLLVRVRKGDRVLAVKGTRVRPAHRVMLVDGNHDGVYVERNWLSNFLLHMERSGFDVAVDRSGSIKASVIATADVYVITQTTAPFSPTEVKNLKKYLEKGGGVLFSSCADFYKTHGAESLNTVLEKLGSRVRINDDLVKDDTDNYGDTPYRAWIPKYHVFPNEIVPRDPKIECIITHGGPSLLDDTGQPLAPEHEKVIALAVGDEDSYTVDADESGDAVPIATGTPIVVDAAEEIGEGRIAVFGGTHLSDRDYTDSDEGTHQTPRYNLRIMGWLCRRRQDADEGAIRLRSATTDAMDEARRNLAVDAIERRKAGEGEDPIRPGRSHEELREWLRRREAFRALFGGGDR